MVSATKGVGGGRSQPIVVLFLQRHSGFSPFLSISDKGRVGIRHIRWFLTMSEQTYRIGKYNFFSVSHIASYGVMLLEAVGYFSPILGVRGIASICNDLSLTALN